MKQKGYNNAVSSNGNSVAQKYKTYQGQEFTEDLGLNWHEWKYRMSDPSIGRFMSIDPLAEDYAYNSTYAFQENKLGMGTELEGAELLPHPWMVADAAANPNGVSAHAFGVSNGLANTVTGLWDAVTSPVQTAKGIGNMLVAGAVGNNPAAMLEADATLGTNSFGTAAAMSQSIDGAINDVVSGNGFERGTVIGEVIGAVAGSKGTNALTKTITTGLKSTKSTTLFRAVSGAELDDISANGLRNTTGQYETGKLFTNSAENASQFGRNNFGFDGQPNTIIKAQVPNSVMNNSTKFTADGMPAISVPANQLNKIKNVTPTTSSPIPNN